MLKSLSLAAALAMATAGIASADEVYSAKLRGSNEAIPDIVYEIDRGQEAVWVFQDGSARFYIDGLGGVFSGRERYDGWFIVYNADDDPCPGDQATDHNGKQSQFWGRLSISWSDDANFVISTGECGKAIGTGQSIVGSRR